MKNTPTETEVLNLFNNNDPVRVWKTISDIIRRISPDYDFTLLQTVYDDVLSLFHGEYPGYCDIKTPYHDLPHTLEVVVCGVRLIHGVHQSGDHISDDEITLIICAMLMHDVGYAQAQGTESGTGAQYTRTHVQRGIDFMKHYFRKHKLSAKAIEAMDVMIQGTNHTIAFTSIEFKDERTRTLARIVATADITGQMADRIYLEKLLYLYFEFKEARLGSFQSTFELLCNTKNFYQETIKKLDDALGGVYRKLEFHFRDTMGVDNNYYIESIEKNMNYLQKIIAQDEATYHTMLKRNGIVAKSGLLA